jgi:hypothetical protein
MPHALSPLIRRIAAAALAVVLAASAAMGQRAPDFDAWPETDFENAIVDLSEIISGGVGRDGIPAIDDPAFLPATGETALGPREPVLTYAPEGEPARAYPLRYLTWHEIVNDTVAGVPVAVTFCPLCNTALVFDRRVEGGVLTFGVSGNLRHSDMVMFDRETESWWQQATGQGIVGHHAGTRLTPLVSWVESWESFLAATPTASSWPNRAPTAPMAATRTWATTAARSPSSSSARLRPTASRRSRAWCAWATGRGR